MKIVSSGKVLNSREFYKKKIKKRRFQLILLAIGFLALVSVLVYVSRKERFLITDVVVLGENVIDKDELRQKAEDLLAKHYLWLFPRSNILTYPRGEIRQSLLKAFPRLKSLDLNLDQDRRLEITVFERVPFALYCNGISDSPIISLKDQVKDCFFIDKEGLIFALAPLFSSGVYFIYLTETLLENPIGQRFVTLEEFNALQRFITNLVSLNITPSAFLIKTDEYRLILSNGGEIIWRKASELSLIYSNLEAFLNDEAIRTQSNFLDRVRYLDLRTVNKVFYKFK